MTNYNTHPSDPGSTMTIERIGNRLSIVHGISTDSLDVVPGHITITMPNELTKTYYVNFRMKCHPEANQGQLEIWDSNTEIVFSLCPNLNRATHDSYGATRAAHGIAGDPQNVYVGGHGKSFANHDRINDHQRRARSRSPSYERLREVTAKRVRSPRPYSKTWDNGRTTREQQASKTNSDQRCSAAQTKCQGELGFCQYVLMELMKPELKNLSSRFQNINISFPYQTKIIKKNMDLATVESKLKAGEYKGLQGFEADIRLIFSNCLLLNRPTDPIYEMSRQFEAVFNRQWAKRDEWMQKHNLTHSGVAPDKVVILSD